LRNEYPSLAATASTIGSVNNLSHFWPGGGFDLNLYAAFRGAGLASSDSIAM